jgi:hypothetical protein
VATEEVTPATYRTTCDNCGLQSVVSRRHMPEGWASSERAVWPKGGGEIRWRFVLCPDCSDQELVGLLVAIPNAALVEQALEQAVTYGSLDLVQATRVRELRSEPF